MVSGRPPSRLFLLDPPDRLGGGAGGVLAGVTAARNRSPGFEDFNVVSEACRAGDSLFPVLEECLRGGGGGIAFGISFVDVLGEALFEVFGDMLIALFRAGLVFRAGGSGGADKSGRSSETVGFLGSGIADCRESCVSLERLEPLRGRVDSPAFRRVGGGGGGGVFFRFC